MADVTSDIIEIKIFDSSHQLFFKGKARTKDKKEMKHLGGGLREKGINLSKSGWFD